LPAKHASLFLSALSLRLPRACLGKLIILVQYWLKRGCDGAFLVSALCGSSGVARRLVEVCHHTEHAGVLRLEGGNGVCVCDRGIVQQAPSSSQ